MIKTLMDGVCTPADELAIAKILLFSKKNGDLSTVLQRGGGKKFKERIRSKVDDNLVAVALIKSTLGK